MTMARIIADDENHADKEKLQKPYFGWKSCYCLAYLSKNMSSPEDHLLPSS
jgi:hypothetical protein